MEPITRKEHFYNAILSNEEAPTPITRQERWLKEIAENGGGGGGTSDYEQLSNKPQINGVTLSGNKTTQELGILASGADTFDDYESAVEDINEWASDHRGVGDNIYVIATGVPDLWVSSVDETSVPYTYTTDEAIVEALETDGYVQIGYYKLSALETQKVSVPTIYVNDELVNTLHLNPRIETREKPDGTTEEVTYYVAQGSIPSAAGEEF